MGDRLFVSDGDLVAYGTTLFGYVDDKTFKQFKSYKVLKKIFPKWVTLELNHKEKTFSIYKLSAEQFREFFLAYAEDYMIHNSMRWQHPSWLVRRHRGGRNICKGLLR